MYFHDLDAYEDWNDNLQALGSKVGPFSARVKKALEIVEKYHDQPRISAKGNYNRHPLRVARILAEELDLTNETSVLIALCHDLGEWSEYNIEDLKEEFGPEVYEGVRHLTWDQKGEWSDFVQSIVSSSIKDLIAIKVADKLDNNRSAALSGDTASKKKAKEKTLKTILPLVDEYYPEMRNAYDEVLARL